MIMIIKSPGSQVDSPVGNRKEGGGRKTRDLHMCRQIWPPRCPRRSAPGLCAKMSIPARTEVGRGHL